MSSKIEVSRKFIEGCAILLEWYGDVPANERAKELRAILAAPAVERQPVAYLDIGAGGYMDLGSDLTDEQLQALPNGRHMLGIVGTYGIDGWKPALAFSTGYPDPVAYATFDDGGKIKIWSRSAKVVEDIARHGEKGIPLYTAPPELAELAELQVTIERLTAESERLARVEHQSREALQVANQNTKQVIAERDALAERLNGGQGEPVAYADPKSFENFKNLAHLGGLYAHEWMWANPAPGLKPLYASRPEPVAVVLPERKREDAYDESQSVITYHAECGWNLYDDELKRLNPWLIDKVKELNK